MSLSPRSPKATPNVFPASQYLQERLDERRARKQRPRRSRQSDTGPQPVFGRDDDIFVNEGEIARSSPRHIASSTSGASPATAASDAGTISARPRGPGARQLDEQLDRLTKQNFDLKLEIDHRRAYQAKLNAELERMRATTERAEQLMEEHAELLRINSELVEELEKRDKAMQEAVEIICDLEEKVDELQDDRQSVTHASTIHADSGYAGTETLEGMPATSPEKPKQKKAPPKLASPSAASHKLNSALQVSPARSKREPSFMLHGDESTLALRTVYKDSGKRLRSVKSFHSILSKHASTIDDGESQADALHSPRFSNISESSFPSIYSPNKHAWEPEDTQAPTPSAQRGHHTRQDSLSRVSEWIDGHEVAEAGQNVSTLTSQFQSLNNALSQSSALSSAQRAALTDSRRSSRTPTSFGGPIFGEPLMAAPSEAAHQRLLRSSRSTIIGERSLADTPIAKLRSLEAELRTTPKQMRSSVELNSAYVSNLEFRKAGPTYSSSPEDDIESVNPHYRPQYVGYPDGGSILLGTPSRFFKQESTLPTSKSRTIHYQEPSTRPRRQSSSTTTTETRKPTFVRAGTSPNILPSLMTAGMTSRPKTSGSGDVISPISYYSNSSSNRTAFGTADQRARTISPPEPRSPPRNTSSRGRDRVPASPARTLSQKTQQLFRRLSGSHGSDVRDRMRTVSPSPSRPTLPTLTSTPSSAYINVIPKEMRRAQANIASASPISVQSPTPARPRTNSEVRQTATTPSVEMSGERKGFFGRRGSFKQIAGLERSKTTTPSSGRGRRPSVREAIATGRRWP